MNMRQGFSPNNTQLNMNTRTEQDNDISLYTWAELCAMKYRYEDEPNSKQIFTKNQVWDELERREPGYKNLIH